MINVVILYSTRDQVLFEVNSQNKTFAWKLQTIQHQNVCNLALLLILWCGGVVSNLLIIRSSEQKQAAICSTNYVHKLDIIVVPAALLVT